MACAGAPAVTTAVTTARNSAPPTCTEVLSRPETMPCSWSSTPLVAWMLSEGKTSAQAAPISSIDGRTTAAYTGSRSTRRNSAYPRAMKAKPSAISRGVPNRSTIAPTFVEDTATSAPAGRNASAVCSADQPSRDCMYSVVRNWKPT